MSDFLNGLGKEHGNPACLDEYFQGAHGRIRGQCKVDNFVVMYVTAFTKTFSMETNSSDVDANDITNLSLLQIPSE